VSIPPTAVLVQLPWTRASDSLQSANDAAPAAEYSAILVMALVSLEGGNVRLSETTPDGLPRMAGTPSATPSARPVLPTSDDGLPAYLIDSDVVALAATRAVSGTANETTSPDAGLAAVDAAFGLLAHEENLASGLLPADSRDAQPAQWRGNGWPMWFVLLAAASGGGAVYACPGLRRHRGTNGGESEVTRRGIGLGEQ
jgi:hypothetical protein